MCIALPVWIFSISFGKPLTLFRRFYALGSLFQSHGNETDALQVQFIKMSTVLAYSIIFVWHYLFPQTWVKIADCIHKDDSCPDIYGHIVLTLSQTQDRDAVWKFAEWTLQKNQEVFFFPSICIDLLVSKLFQTSMERCPLPQQNKAILIKAIRQFLMITCPFLKDRCADFQQASSRRSNANSRCSGSFEEVPTGIDFVPWVLNKRFKQWGGCSSKPHSKSNNIISSINLPKPDTCP